MPRARNIKPGFFKNEDLVEQSYEGRLLFAGLWCLADREGRLEDRPKRIKMELFPADNLDIEPLLDALHDRGLILRYQIDGHRYIHVINFLEHQNPHYKEPQSKIPEPRQASDLPPYDRNKTHGLSGYDKTKTRGDPEATPRQASDLPPDKRGVNPADSLIPDSLIPESREKDPPDGGSKKARGTRLPADWVLPDDWLSCANDINPQVDAKAESAAFRDYWVAVPGQKAVKLDWLATWRNWIRRAKPSKGTGGKSPNDGSGHADVGSGGQCDDPCNMPGLI